MNCAKLEEWRQRKAQIIVRYGDLDAATAPCPREKLLIAAVAPWRAISEEWTVSVDGWRGDGSAYRDMPARALEAIKYAIPMPKRLLKMRSLNAISRFIAPEQHGDQRRTAYNRMPVALSTDIEQVLVRTCSRASGRAWRSGPCVQAPNLIAQRVDASLKEPDPSLIPASIDELDRTHAAIQTV